LVLIADQREPGVGDHAALNNLILSTNASRRQ